MLQQFEEQKMSLANKNESLEGEIREAKKKLVIKQDQMELLEKEYAKLQDKYREVQNHEFNLSTQKEQQDATMKI